MCGIDVHFNGDTFDTKAIQVTFNAKAKCLISKEGKHTFEIMEGFVSPLLGKTNRAYKFELIETGGWKNVSVGESVDYPELPKSDYLETEDKGGCASVVASLPLSLVTLSMGAVAFGRKRRMKDEE